MEKSISRAEGIDSSVKDYLALMKPRIASLVLLTAFAGMFLEGRPIHPLIGFLALLCVFTAAGSAGALNMWYDKDIDALMRRTRSRPTVTGAVEPEEALAFGIVTGILSVVIASVFVNPETGFALAFSILYYFFIYTALLKRTSPQNVVIGGVSGALPPVIGALASTGEVTLQSFLWFLTIFAWTPAHSWALSIFKAEDYAAAKIPMMNLEKGERETKKLIIFYSILTFAASSLPFFLGFSGYIYASCAFASGSSFIYKSVILFKKDLKEEAKGFFIYSIFYLAALFCASIIDRIIL